MSTPALVADFYERLWHRQERAALDELLDEAFSFRGSLGAERIGREPFWAYLQEVCGALGEYRCEILDCVAEGDTAFAKMRFSGRHRAEFRGFAPTQRQVAWHGAAHFRFRAGRIVSLWVLGDLAGLDALLREQARA